jgi:hypothetical protein
MIHKQVSCKDIGQKSLKEQNHVMVSLEPTYVCTHYKWLNPQVYTQTNLDYMVQWV